MYHCSWPSGVRSLVLPLQLISGLRWKQKDVYLSLRSAYREGVIGLHTTIARLMSSSPERPFQLKLPAVAAWEREYNIKLVDVKMPPLPWNGSSPVVLLFSVQNRWETWLTLALGRCTRRREPSHDRVSQNASGTSGSDGARPQHCLLGSHYAVICYARGGAHEPCSHSPIGTLVKTTTWTSWGGSTRRSSKGGQTGGAAPAPPFCFDGNRSVPRAQH